MYLLTESSCNGSSDCELTSAVLQKDVQNHGMYFVLLVCDVISASHHIVKPVAVVGMHLNY